MKPHRCPVCKGRGKVKAGFYPDDRKVTTCKSCSGCGVLWAQDAPQVVPSIVPYPVPYEPWPTLPWYVPSTPYPDPFKITYGTTSTTDTTEV